MGNIFLSMIGLVLTHIVAGVLGALLFAYYIEPWIKHKQLLKRLEEIAWLFPISQDKPEMHFKCSLKDKDFFGSAPPTYRKYVHSAEVLALQKLSENLSPLGVHLLPDAFYGSLDRSANVLLLGSDANVEMSKTILDGIKKHIGYEVPPSGEGHRYFTSGSEKYCCKHIQGADGMARVIEDYGVIVRRTLSNDHVVLLLAGIHMHGTLAAAEVALNPAFQKRVLERKYTNFAQIVHTKVLENGTSLDMNSLEDWKTLPFVKFD